jgi:hypothetical protein
MLCTQCGREPATGAISISTLASDGTQTSTTERLCVSCFAAWQAARDAEQAAVEARVRADLADGTLFEQLRADLAPALAAGDPEALAQAAEFLDLVSGGLATPLPDDLQALADRYRRPAA